MNLTSEVAPATSTVPHLRPMADIIDSLKRLERVGSENSKTTQKLIAAATELERLIVTQFDCFGGEVRFHRAGNRRGTQFKPPFGFDYRVKDRELVNTGWDMNRRDFHGLSVSDNRESAMRFAEDLVAGLLDVIETELANAHKEAIPALETLENALSDIHKRKS